MYTLEDCTYYTKLNIQGKPIYIFDPHNMALPVWGSYAAELGPLHLITFDSHTDSHPPFAKFLMDRRLSRYSDWRMSVKKYPEVRALLASMRCNREDYSFDDVFRYSNKMLNTEQIKTGVAFGYLSSYTIRYHKKENYERHDRQSGYDATYINDRDDRIPEIRLPLILDIDLDFFRSRDEMGQEFIDYFAPYFKSACAVTIAREPSCFETEKNKSDFTVGKIGFTIEKAEERLLEIMETC